jgi:2-oxoisovalerate dehydrogenase E2 component (dihydrolipoyl transacylase)
MSRFIFKLPDLGEGTVEAEIVAWRVKPGDVVKEDDVVAEVMTEKAVVEVPAPVSGTVVSVTGVAGDKLAVGSELIVIETVEGAAAVVEDTPAASANGKGASHLAEDDEFYVFEPGELTSTNNKAPALHVVPDLPKPEPVAAEAAEDVAADSAQDTHAKNAQSGLEAASASGSAITASGNAHGARAISARSAPSDSDGENGPHANGAVLNGSRSGRVATSPAIRRRAREAGVDLTSVPGSGPHGRIMRKDFEEFLSAQVLPFNARSKSSAAPAGGVEEIKVIGLRRVIAQRMSESKRNIPHFAYVEEVDVTELESLRRHLNSKQEKGAPSLTYLPFLVAALTRVLPDFPQINALYDAERNVLLRHSAVHVGVATQTPDGLKVPVVKDAQARSLWELSAEIRRVSEAARTNKATREELSGSTITVTSLGKLGGIASTPIINAPELAIIGVNRAVERPMVYDGAITIRRMMNLSSSFDHRFVDGHDAAALIQEIKERLEHPATIFMTS